jgi:hypothetical protein
VSKETYENLHDNHMKYHNVKKWLLDGAIDEDANTIREAVERIDEATLKRRLARALLKD